jgi:solute carrier family 26 (sodium-independent sulfate anion transporter), member 11
MSTVVGNVVLKLEKSNPEIPGHVVASALALIAGAIILFIGLIRAGWIVEFIPLVAISAFMTGSAITIIAGQVPLMMGITSFNALDAPYKITISTLRHLNQTKLDAAMGLTALTMLYLIRFACNFAAKRNPSQRKLFFFLSTLRTAFVISLYTTISLWFNRGQAKPLFKILGEVPSGT